MYMEKIKELLDINDGAMIPVFVMEKKDVNMLENKTKGWYSHDYWRPNAQGIASIAKKKSIGR